MSSTATARVTHREQRFDVAHPLVDSDQGLDVLSPLTSLVQLAVESDDSARLIAAAGSELGQPLGLVAATGEPLAYAPDDAHGRRALAVAAAAARKPEIAPPGWRVVPIIHASARLALLAVRGQDDGNGTPEKLLELIGALLGEQLTRAELVRSQTAAFVRRLVSAPGLGAERARQEGQAVGVAVADAYWPAVLAWSGASGLPDVAASIDREARRLVPDSLTANVDGHIVLLYPGHDTAPEATAWLEQLVARARRLLPSSRAQALTTEAAVPLDELNGQVAQLLRLCAIGPRADPAQPVAWARQFALDRLLWEHLATPDARSFVEGRLGALISWDRAHASDLLGVLEAALDFPRHDQAARRCFMHRNTFRHRLRQATDLLGHDIEDPDVRLAVHVALKLRRGLAAAGSHAGESRTTTPPRARGRP
jgi:sugar diacid utilization regulator